MKTKLTLADIAWYLPYGLKCKETYSDGKRMYKEVINVVGHNEEIKCIAIRANVGYKFTPTTDIKPLLNPMSALTNPLIVEGYNGGEEFMPMIELMKVDNKYDRNDIAEYRIGELQLLSQWHFDFNGLIEQGLAVDKTKV